MCSISSSIIIWRGDCSILNKLFLWLSLCFNAKVWLKCFVFIFPSRSVVLRDKKKLTRLTVIAVDMTHIPSSCDQLSAASRLSKLLPFFVQTFCYFSFLLSVRFGFWFINLLIFNHQAKRDGFFFALNNKLYFDTTYMWVNLLRPKLRQFNSGLGNKRHPFYKL